MANPTLSHANSSAGNTTDDVRSPVDVAGMECGQPTLQLLDDLQFMVRDVLSQWQHPADAVERRSSRRIPFNKSIALFAVDEESEEPVGQPFLVTGRDISAQGVGFSHDGPLPNTKVAVAFEIPGGCSQFVLVKLTWCRFTRRGTYESGGTFLRPISPPIDAPLDWTAMPRL